MKLNLHPSVFLAGAAALLPFNSCSSETPKPNIVLIMADDLGAECLGCYGGTSYETPVLDSLARQGVLFSQCYSQPLSTPSRVKLMTGKYNFRNYEVFGYLNPDQKTFGNLMKEAGYTTCIAGKWQLNGISDQNNLKPNWDDLDRPHHFGFDEYCLWQLHRPARDGERYADPLIFRDGKKIEGLDNSYGPDIFCNFVTDFIDRNAKKPFFVYYPMVLVHNPFVPTPGSETWSNKNERYRKDNGYFKDMVEYMDMIVGRVVNKLKEKGVWENTIFIFTGDNGTNVKIKSLTRTGVIIGGKGSSLNTGNHVPLIILWPSKIRASEVSDCLIDFADFLPTLGEFTGVNTINYQPDGKSFLSVLFDKEKSTQKEIFIHYSPHWGNFTSNRWVMNSDFKLYQNGAFYYTPKDPLEKSPLIDLSSEEKKIKEHFESVLLKMEKISHFAGD